MLSIRLIVGLLSILLCLGVCWQISRGKLSLRYSLLWLALATAILFFSVYPAPIYSLSNLLGFTLSSNFIFFVALFFLMMICLSLSRTVSNQQEAIKDLVQHLAILESKCEDAAHNKPEDRNVE